MRDQDRQMREKLIEVLQEFHLDYEDKNLNGAPALCFQINRVTRNYPYKGGDHRANLNAATILRRLLIQNGYSPNITQNHAPGLAPKKTSEVRTKPPADDEAATVFAKLSPAKPEAPRDYDAAMAQFQTLQNNGQDYPVTTPSPSSEPAAPAASSVAAKPDPIILESEPMAAISDEPAPIPSVESKVDDSLALNNEHFMVYTPKPEYVPAEVMIIRLNHDLIANAGDCLVIPIHAKQETMALSYSETMARYALKPKEQPVVNIAPSIPVEAQKTLPVAAAPIQPEIIAAASVPQVRSTPLAIVADPPVREPRKELFGKPRVTTMAGISQEAVRQPIIKELTGKNKISVTLARMLVALYRAHTEQNLEWMPSTLAKDYLNEAELKQFASRMPKALEQGLAVRMRRDAGPGYQWKLTEAGKELCLALYTPPIRGKSRNGAWAGA